MQHDAQYEKSYSSGGKKRPATMSRAAGVLQLPVDFQEPIARRGDLSLMIFIMTVTVGYRMQICLRGTVFNGLFGTPKCGRWNDAVPGQA